MESATIKSVTSKGLLAPLPQPHRTASGTVTEAQLVTFEIDCGDVVGCSYIFDYSPLMVKPTVAFTEALADFLVGESLEPARIFDALQARFRILGTTGLVGTVVSGIDMALWDAFAKQNGMPLVAALGGKACAVPVYESMGMVRDAEEERRLLRDLEKE